MDMASASGVELSKVKFSEGLIDELSLVEYEPHCTHIRGDDYKNPNQKRRIIPMVKPRNRFVSIHYFTKLSQITPF